MRNVALGQQIPKAVIVMLLPLFAWAPTAHADEYAAVMGNERLTLACDGPMVVDTPCRIGIGSSGNTDPVRFTPPGKLYRYPHLLKKGLEKVLENEQHPLRPSAAEEVAYLKF